MNPFQQLQPFSLFSHTPEEYLIGPQVADEEKDDWSSTTSSDPFVWSSNFEDASTTSTSSDPFFSPRRDHDEEKEALPLGAASDPVCTLPERSIQTEEARDEKELLSYWPEVFSESSSSTATSVLQQANSLGENRRISPHECGRPSPLRHTEVVPQNGAFQVTGSGRLVSPNAQNSQRPKLFDVLEAAEKCLEKVSPGEVSERWFTSLLVWKRIETQRHATPEASNEEDEGMSSSTAQARKPVWHFGKKNHEEEVVFVSMASPRSKRRTLLLLFEKLQSKGGSFANFVLAPLPTQAKHLPPDARLNRMFFRWARYVNSRDASSQPIRTGQRGVRMFNSLEDEVIWGCWQRIVSLLIARDRGGIQEKSDVLSHELDFIDYVAEICFPVEEKVRGWLRPPMPSAVSTSTS